MGCRTTKERNARGRAQGLPRRRPWALGGDAARRRAGKPSYLALDREEKFLYCVHGDKDYVSSFKIDEESGGLTQIGRAAAGGKNPVFISVDKGNRRCFVATLQGGKVSTLERLPDGSLSEPVHEAAIPGIEAGSVSYPHQCLQDVEGNFLIVPIQGRKTGTARSTFTVSKRRLPLAQRPPGGASARRTAPFRVSPEQPLRLSHQRKGTASPALTSTPPPVRSRRSRY
ncbi:MAG: lactonase family protein [Cloacibacillus evryensis]